MSKANTSMTFTELLHDTPNKVRLKQLADKLGSVKINKKEEVKVICFEYKIGARECVCRET